MKKNFLMTRLSPNLKIYKNLVSPDGYITLTQNTSVENMLYTLYEHLVDMDPNVFAYNFSKDTSFWEWRNDMVIKDF